MAKKEAELAPYIAAALARKKVRKPLEDHEIEKIPALGRSIIASLKSEREVSQK